MPADTADLNDRPTNLSDDMPDGPAAEPLFDVVSDGGLDAFPDLLNDVPVAPFSMHFGPETLKPGDISRQEFFSRLVRGDPHPTTSQPAPDEFAELFRAATRPLLVVTISSGLSGSYNAADQALGLVPDADVTLHDSRTLSAAQALQVHAAMMARARGHDIDTAIDWMQQVHAATELFFAIDTLEYLQRGGRIGRVKAALGAMLSLKPVITVDKESGTYVNVGRSRSWAKVFDALVQQVTKRFGEGTPLRAGVMYGDEPADGEQLQQGLAAAHELLWSDVAPVGAVLAVHTGPKAIGLAAAAGAWPWEV